MRPDSSAGVLSQFKSEIAIILVLVNLILVFVLMSDVQSLLALGPARRASSAKTTTSGIVAIATATPQVKAASVQTATSAPTPVAASSNGTVWPLRGRVTTEFGGHTPYQSFHTGIDISSHQPAGRMAITPFRAGVVVQTIQSSYGLGNHVIVDQGGGITAYYCHLNSISVQRGQAVKPGDTLGYEGSTGATTGTHLHLDIRQNGQSVNPRGFIAGNPN